MISKVTDLESLHAFQKRLDLLDNILGELVANVCRLFCQVRLQVILLASQRLDFFAVKVELLSQRLARLLKSIDFALERGVVAVSVVRCGRRCVHYLIISTALTSGKNEKRH